jgi:S-adenosylmethionine hydrolase
MTPLPITFLSDYGHHDEFVGVCHGVIQRIAAGATVIDIAHGLPPQDLAPAALVLRNALPFMPEGVHLAVVDPGVGGRRRPVALRCGPRLLVGPDNGLLMPAAERAGGVELAVDLSSTPWRLEPVSATFHGRDLFAPVAAHLALGEPLEQAGETFAPSELVRLELPQPGLSDGGVSAHSVYVDRFGNVQLNLAADDMAKAGLEPSGGVAVETSRGRFEALYARTFVDVPHGELIAYADSYGVIALAVNGGSAAAVLGIGAGAPVRLSRLAGGG